MSLAIAKSAQNPVALNANPVGVVSLVLPAAAGAVTGRWIIFGKVVVQIDATRPIPPTEVDIQIAIPGPVDLDRSRVIVPAVASTVSQSFSLQGTLTSAHSLEVVLFCSAHASATAQFARLMAITVDTLE